MVVGYHPRYKWINPTCPIYNWAYNPFTSRGMSHQVLRVFLFEALVLGSGFDIRLADHWFMGYTVIPDNLPVCY